jgi:signal transduction histidine kinase
MLREALAQDAALALWTVCRADQQGPAEWRSLGELAEWLAGSIGTVLTWAEPEPDSALSASSNGLDQRRAAQRQRGWAELAARCYGTARLAALLAKDASLDHERAYLWGLLHAAPQWLASTREDAHDAAATHVARRPSRTSKSGAEAVARSLSAALPGWLQAALGAIRSAEGRVLCTEADCVVAAGRLAGGKTATARGTPRLKIDRTEHAASVALVRQQWLEAAPRESLLPAVAARLARCEQLEQTFDRTLETEKLDSLKELAYGAGHEINNPLANISARAQTLLRDETHPERRRLLAAIHTQAFRAHEMIADMMLFARPPQPQPALVDLAALVRDVAAELLPQAAAQETELVVNAVADEIRAQVDRAQLAVAVRALCANSLEALGHGGRVDVSLASLPPAAAPPANSHTSGETVQIAVSDNGPGISAEMRRHIFDPFFSGREAGRGLGFGLPKCWRIVSLHGGRIDVDSTPGGGATFTISLPARSDSR